MAKLGSVFINVRAKTDKYKRDLANAKTLTEKNIVYMQHKFDSINFKAAGIAATAFAGVAAIAMKKAIDAASDLEETVGKFDVVFKNHSKQAETMAKELVNSYAMSTREAKQYLSSIQDLLVPMGMVSNKAILMSNAVVKLSADLASFNNVPTAAAMADIQSALVGNFETMKKYGVVLNETVIKQEALSRGLWDGKGMVDANTKAQIAFALMLKGSAAAIGDQQRTMGSYANQIKQLTANSEDLKAMLGNELLPVATDVVAKMNDWIKANDGLIKQKTKETVDEITKSIQGLVDIYNVLPDGMVGAAGYGIVGAIMFGGPAGKIIGALVLLDATLSKIGLGVSDIVEKHKASGNALIKLYKSIVAVFGGGDGTLTFPFLEYTREHFDKMQLAINQIKEYEKLLNNVGGGGASTPVNLKALQDANQKKYALTIAAAKKVKKDLWMLEEKHQANKLKSFEDGIEAKTQFEYDAERQAIKDREKLLEKALKDQVKAYEHMADNVHDVFATMYENILTGQENVFDTILDSFTKMIAEMAAKASTDLVMNIAFGGSGSTGGGSGILGKIGSTIFGGGGSGGGGFGLSSLGRLFSGKAAPGLMAGDGAFGSAAIGNNSWASMISGAGSLGVIAAAATVATKVLGRMFSDKPQFGISGMSKEDWKFGTGSNGPGTDPYTIAMENMYDDFKSGLYDYRVFAADFDNEPQIRETLFSYFDTVFSNVDKAISTNINDILKSYEHLGVSFRVTDEQSFEQAFSGLSNAVFSELLGSLLLSALPGSGAMEKSIKTIVGSQYVTAGSVLDKNAPKPGSREFYDNAGFSSQGKGTGADPYLYTEPVYDNIKHQVSAMADIFNTEFFQAIMPEGGSTWDSFISFTDIVKKTTDFMQKFNDRINDFGLSSVEAYQQIAFVTNTLAELDAVIENMNLDPVAATVKTMIEGFDLLNESLKKANATNEELNKSQTVQNQIFNEKVKELSKPTAAIFQSMADSVKNFVFNADQLKIQKIASQGEKINKFFTDLYDAAVLAGDQNYINQLDAVKKGFKSVVGTLQMVEGLNLDKSHLQTIGSTKAEIAGLSNEYSAMTLGQKYGVQLGTSKEQASIVKSIMGKSAIEFVNLAALHNISVTEAANDLKTLADIVQETSSAFEGIQESMSDTIESLEIEFGVGGQSSLSEILKKFNKAAGDAMSLDPVTAAAGAAKLSDLSGKAMKKALETAKTSYEYNKIWSKVLGTLKDVEYSTGKTVTALEIVDPKAQLTELQNIATDIGLIDTGIAALLNEQTFIDYYDAFNIAFNNGAVFNNLNSTLISLPSALGSAFGSISLNASAGLIQALTDIAVALGIQPTYPGGTVTNPITGKTGPASVSDPSQWMPWQLDTSSLAISPDNEQTILQKYGAGGYTKTEVSAFIKDFQGMSLGEKGAAYPDLDIAQLGQDINKLTSAYGYAEGGIATGPKSGYSALLHGTEAIIPMGGGDIPLVIKNDYSKDLLSEIKALRSEIKQIGTNNAMKVKKIEKTLQKVTQGLTTIRTTEIA